jgi:hypothetical protein
VTSKYLACRSGPEIVLAWQMELGPQAARSEKRPLSSTMTGGDLRVVGSLDRYSNCQGHKDEDEDKMNLHGLSRRSSAFDEAVPADLQLLRPHNARARARAKRTKCAAVMAHLPA